MATRCGCARRGEARAESQGCVANSRVATLLSRNKVAWKRSPRKNKLSPGTVEGRVRQGGEGKQLSRLGCSRSHVVVALPLRSPSEPPRLALGRKTGARRRAAALPRLELALKRVQLQARNQTAGSQGRRRRCSKINNSRPATGHLQMLHMLAEGTLSA
jgi:hypothetical protein